MRKTTMILVLAVTTCGVVLTDLSVAPSSPAGAMLTAARTLLPVRPRPPAAVEAKNVPSTAAPTKESPPPLTIKLPERRAAPATVVPLDGGTEVMTEGSLGALFPLAAFAGRNGGSGGTGTTYAGLPPPDGQGTDPGREPDGGGGDNGGNEPGDGGDHDDDNDHGQEPIPEPPSLLLFGAALLLLGTRRLRPGTRLRS